MKYLFFITLLTLSFSNWAKANTEFGFDFNVPSAIAGFERSENFVAGTLSVAKKNSHHEIALPFFFHEHTFDPEICCIVDIRRFDIQTRSYLRKSRQGLYAGLTLRSSNVSGRDIDETNRAVSYHRLGAGVVVGVKTELFDGIFWGANVNYGEFLSEGGLLADGSNSFGFFGPTDYASDKFFNVEFLKLGMRF